MDIRKKQRFFGLLLVILGAAVTGWMWYAALNEGYYYPKTSMLFPAFFVLGIALSLYPPGNTEVPEEGTILMRLKHIPKTWLLVIVISLIAGGLNLFLISR